MTDNKSGLLELVSKYRTQIMGFAAMWIFVYHVRNAIPVFRNVPGLLQVELYCVNIGFCGVDIFLFLSGWGLYHAINRHSLITFYKRRYIRLIPPFLLACLIKALFNHWDILRTVKAATGWTFIFETVHEPLWFVPAIAILYLFFPLYRKAFEKASNKYVFTVAAIALWMVFAVLGMVFSLRTNMYLFINRIPVFLIGVLFGRLTYSGKKDLSRVTKIALPVMFVSGVIIQYFFTFRDGRILLPAPQDGLPATLIAIPMCFGLAKIFSLLDRVTAVQNYYGFVGNMSLEFYAFQEIMIMILCGFFPAEKIDFSGDGLTRAIYVLAAFFLSALSGFLLRWVMTRVNLSRRAS